MILRRSLLRVICNVKTSSLAMVIVKVPFDRTEGILNLVDSVLEVIATALIRLSLLYLVLILVIKTVMVFLELCLVSWEFSNETAGFGLRVMIPC